ncbi:glycosyltransferase family 39 protein [Pseudarthrobacter sp. CC4]|uniref:ArnT family glycosyltransferase n=1 Tax=Pseudarthrobacter sp. CC4 TaxID=3029190 RepID=UPI003B8CA7A4
MDAKALFFGSSDWGNSITVDKPPLSLWVMGLSVRVLGFNPVALLLPQVAMGVGTTLLIYLILRRCASSTAALFGAAVFFTTPIITLMSRYNNPDPLMLLLMVASVWFVLRSIETGRGHLFVVAGALLGLSFMTKQLQGLISVPALGLAFLLFSQQQWSKRLATAAGGAFALAVTGGLWMLVVDLIPQEHRPYVGGSPSNSVLELTFAYNGVERIIGNGAQMPAAMQVPAQFRPVDSDAGFFRLFNANYNQEASWLLLSALVAVGLLAMQWKNLAQNVTTRPLVLISAAWLFTAFLLLSFMGEQIHTYYTAVLGPPLALVLGLTLDNLINRRDTRLVRLSGAAIAMSGLLTAWLVLRSAEWPVWLPTAILGLGIASVATLIVRPPSKKFEYGAAGVLAASLLCGPLVTSVQNVTVGFNGSNPLSGVLSRNPASISHLMESLRNNELPWGHDIAFGRDPDPAVVETLAEADECTWAAASYASQTAARLQLESGRAVMPLGGFAGSDPSPTLKEFKEKVAAGEICYFVEQEAFLEVQASESESTAISRWVHENFSPTSIESTTVYQLTKS